MIGISGSSRPAFPADEVHDNVGAGELGVDIVAVLDTTADGVVTSLQMEKKRDKCSRGGVLGATDDSVASLRGAEKGGDGSKDGDMQGGVTSSFDVIVCHLVLGPAVHSGSNAGAGARRAPGAAEFAAKLACLSVYR